MGAGIGAGSALQVLVGGWLFQRLLTDQKFIDSPYDIFKFALLISPLSCLVGATVGVLTLYQSGAVSLDSMSFNWLTWWVGDTLGAMLFTPLILTLVSTKKWLSIRRKLLSLVPTTIIFSAILALFFSSVEIYRQKQIDQLTEVASRLHLGIEQRFIDSANKLRAYSAFFEASDFVSAVDFDAFSSSVVADDPIFQAVGWTPIVPHQRRAKVEASVRARGYPDFTFTESSANGLVPAAERATYYPVLYIYPFEPNKSAFGLNLGADPSRLAALDRAFDEQRSIATAPIDLVQELDKKVGFILYLPVFLAQQASPLSLAENRLAGYVSGVFRIPTVLEIAKHEAGSIGIGIDIKDVTDKQRPVPMEVSDLLALPGFAPVIHTFELGQRHYQLTFFMSENYGADAKDWSSWIILTGGFLIAALFNSVVLMLTTTSQNIRNEVARKTEDLLSATNAAVEANDAKTNFLANMSHEFRTPLNAIIGLNELCLRTPLTSLQTDYLSKAQLASTTLLALINNTLDYAKIESGMLELENADFSLIAIVEKTHAIFSMQALQKGLTFAVTVPARMPSVLVGDALRVEQVLLNLCSNAFKFTEQGGISLALVIRSQTDTSIALELRVSDTGIGISSAQQTNLFDSFRQADASTARQYGGTGLGLAISRRFVDLMGGGIEVHSELGHGSQFCVRLMFPIAAVSDLIDGTVVNQKLALPLNLRLRDSSEPAFAPAADAPAQAAPSDAPRRALNGLTILIVEDNAMNRLVAEGLLSSEGALVTLAHDGYQALEILEATVDFDLVLLDIQMPGMDGYEVARKIRALTGDASRLPIVAMTANVMPDDVALCLAAGMDDHMGKPLDINAMVDQILDLLGKSTG
jgi:signal transduction histidine kinase